MRDDVYISLFRVLDSEQQIITRTDQKAFTMLSLMGVFMVFFLVHFTKIQINWFNFSMLILYLGAALLALIQLIMVIHPRIRKAKDREDLPEIKEEVRLQPTTVTQTLTIPDYATVQVMDWEYLILKKENPDLKEN